MCPHCLSELITSALHLFFEILDSSRNTWQVVQGLHSPRVKWLIKAVCLFCMVVF